MKWDNLGDGKYQFLILLNVDSCWCENLRNLGLNFFVIGRKICLQEGYIDVSGSRILDVVCSCCTKQKLGTTALALMNANSPSSFFSFLLQLA
jgi:hypothetical protein